MEELINRLERVIQTGAPDKDGMHPISAETVLEVVKAQLSTNCSEFPNNSDAISRQAAIDAFYLYPNINWTTLDILKKINEIPTIQPEIIYCGDGCKFWNRHTGGQKGTCYILRQCTSENFYCGNAKRRER